MEIAFYKYHGTGNDFILLDNRSGSIDLTNLQINTLCDRHFGIGGDGLIMIRESDRADFHMTYHNADGHEGSFCGNGGRCAAAFYDFLSGPVKSCSFTASDGLHTATMEKAGLPGHHKVEISFPDVTKVIEMSDGFFVDTGSPHFLLPVTDIAAIDVVKQGRKLRNDDAFKPAGTNVNFLEIKGEEIQIRTYERGVENETLSCGTGVVAAAVIFHALNKSNKKRVCVKTLGGELEVSMNHSRQRFTDIRLLGSAVRVFNGKIDIRK
jgi:diaminopimelate epimerase